MLLTTYCGCVTCMKCDWLFLLIVLSLTFDKLIVTQVCLDCDLTPVDAFAGSASLDSWRLSASWPLRRPATGIPSRCVLL